MTRFSRVRDCYSVWFRTFYIRLNLYYQRVSTLETLFWHGLFMLRSTEFSAMFSAIYKHLPVNTYAS